MERVSATGPLRPRAHMGAKPRPRMRPPLAPAERALTASGGSKSRREPGV